MEIDERIMVLDSVIKPEDVWNNIPKEQTFEKIGESVLVGISYICPISNVKKGYKLKLLNTVFYNNNTYIITIQNELAEFVIKLKEDFLLYYTNHQIGLKSKSRFQS